MSIARSDLSLVDITKRRLLMLGRPRRTLALARRERRVETAVAASFLAAAFALIVAFPARGPISLPLTAALLVTYAVVSRIEYELGAGYTVPTQIVFVPMLFLIPTPAVPLLVALGFTLGKLPHYLRRKEHPERIVLNLADAWHAVGPTLVFALAAVHEPSWDDWPIYLAALASQLAGDFVVATVREWGAETLPLRDHVAGFALVSCTDAFLSPIGLFAAFAAVGHPYVIFALLLPFAAMLELFTRERRGHLEKKLSGAYDGTARVLTQLLEGTSSYTGDHSRDVLSLSLAVAEELGVDAQGERELELAALLHDVGKIALPKQVLDKAGPLSDEEWGLMKTHTIQGQRLLDQVGGTLADAGPAVRASHERWDGRGYPDGLAGERIPLAARVVCCSDAFHAMTSDRPYRAALPVESALNELRLCAGSQFDPRVVEAMVTVVQRSGDPLLGEHEPEPDAEPRADDVPGRSFAAGGYPSLLGELEADAEHIAAVAEMTHQLASATTREDARGAICSAAVDATQASAAALFEPAGGRLLETAQVGGEARQRAPSVIEPARLGIELDGPRGAFLREGHGRPGLPEALVGTPGASSTYLQPVVRGGELLGVVAVFWRRKLTRLPESGTAMMSLLAAEAAVAIERTELLARLEAAARTDDLTGLLRRGAWLGELERELARARREQRSFCVAMLDIDHFKRFNDECGHPAGDQLLRESVRAWQSELRLSDRLGRYGGDEFVALLPSCTLESGQRLVERLSTVTVDGQTCSAGIAAWDGSESAGAVMARADAALLEAKRKGRNQVTVAAPPG